MKQVPQANSQGTGYYGKVDFTTIDGVATTYPAFTSLSTKTPDLGGRGFAYLFEGDPSRQEVRDVFVTNNQLSAGQFYHTMVSNDKIEFVLE